MPTRPFLLEGMQVLPPDAGDVLSPEKSLQALAAVRHAKWFQVRGRAGDGGMGGLPCCSGARARGTTGKGSHPHGMPPAGRPASVRLSGTDPTGLWERGQSARCSGVGMPRPRSTRWRPLGAPNGARLVSVLSFGERTWLAAATLEASRPVPPPPHHRRPSWAWLTARAPRT